MSFQSQAGQDRFLSQQVFFDRRDGLFVDVGAHDGKSFSNTFYFEKKLGWSGICIEPLPDVFALLEACRDCECLRGCAYNDTGVSAFTVVKNKNMLSGLSEHLEKNPNAIGKSEIETDTFRLSDVFSERSIDTVDYLSVDTEGSEMQVLTGIDWDNVHINAISIEHNGYLAGGAQRKKTIFDFLSKRGFDLVASISNFEFIFVNSNFRFKGGDVTEVFPQLTPLVVF